MASNSPNTRGWAYGDGQPLNAETLGDKPSNNSAIVDPTDADANSKLNRESKLRGSQKQARDSHVLLTIKALDDLSDQVLRRDGVKGGKRRILDFLEVEKGATEQTIVTRKKLLSNIEEYGTSLKKVRV